MKLSLFGTLLLFTRTFVLGEINDISGEISEKHGRKFYDVHQLVRDVTDNIETIKKIDGGKGFLMSNDVQNKIKDLNFLNIIPALINSISNATNSSCFNDLSYIKQNIDLKHFQDSWALKMLDSFGKPESGILEGNVKWLGDFDECRSVYAPKEEKGNGGGFHAQYCILEATVMKSLPLLLGICLPDTCNPSDFKDIFNNSHLLPVLNQSSINITSLKCKPNSLEISNGGIATLCVMSFFFFLVTLGSFITAFKYFNEANNTKDLCKRSEASIVFMPEPLSNGKLEEPLVITDGSTTKLRAFIEMCDSFLNCFCIFTNGSKLLNTEATEGQLLSLHGIRFLSMTWVILGHVYTSPMGIVKSLKSAAPLIDNLPFQVVLNGWYSVDSFFVLSGFLLSYLYFQERAKRRGKTPWLYFYVHRYLRLTPVYMIVMAFFTTILPLMGSGPYWPHDQNIDMGCQKGWWSNLIYINNLNQDASDQCMSYSWYLANDMQFFVISPIFLITLWRWPTIGFLVSVLFLWGSWISGFLITYQNNLPAGTLSDVNTILSDPTFLPRFNDYMQKVYIKPYTRIAPYIVGIGLGYILFKRKISGLKSSRRTLWIGWLLAIPTGLYCVYGAYHQVPNLLASSLYNAFTRTMYGLSLSWLIFVCLSGQGGVVDKILSYKLFIPLSRLTYCAYLIHPIVVTIYVGSLRSTVEFSHQTVILWYLGLLTVTYAFSLLVSLTFESPLIRLEKLIKNKFQS